MMHFPTSEFGTGQPVDLAAAGATALPAAGGPFSNVARGRSASDGLSPSWFGGTSVANATPPADANPFSGMGGILGAIGGLITLAQSNLQAIIGQIARALAGGSAPAGNAPTASGDVQVDSIGDPHIAVSGTAADGRALDSHFDSMIGHSDLVDANAGIPGGYQVSTTTTAPSASGVTYNQSATVTANDGYDAITFNADGTSQITSNGQAVDVPVGGTVQLDGGETVTKNQNGSLTVNASDGNGGTISTTMSSNGQGVDVKTHAHGLAVAGDAVAQASGTSSPTQTVRRANEPHIGDWLPQMPKDPRWGRIDDTNNWA